MDRLLVLFTVLDDSTRTYISEFGIEEQEWNEYPHYIFLNGDSEKPFIALIDQELNLEAYIDDIKCDVNNYDRLYFCYHISDQNKLRKQQNIESIIPTNKYNYCEVHHNEDNPTITPELEKLAAAFKQNNDQFRIVFDTLLNNSCWKRIDTQKRDKEVLIEQLWKPKATCEEIEVLFPNSLNSYSECWEIFLKCNPWKFHNDYKNKKYREALNELIQCLKL